MSSEIYYINIRILIIPEDIVRINAILLSYKINRVIFIERDYQINIINNIMFTI